MTHEPKPPTPGVARMIAADCDFDAALARYRAALWRRGAEEIQAARSALHDALDAKMDRIADTVADGMRGIF